MKIRFFRLIKILQKEYIFIFFIIIFSLILYLFGINVRGSLIGDEYHTIYAVKNPSRNFNAFLYFLLLNVYIKFFSDKELNLRLFSAFFSSLSLVIAYLLGKVFFGKEKAKVYTFFILFSPFLIYYATEIRFYSLFLFFSLCSLLFFWLYMYYKDKIYFFGLIISNIALVLSHLFGVSIVFIEVLYIWLTKKNLRKRIILLIFLSLLLGFIIYNLPIKQFGWKILNRLTNPLSVYPFLSSKGLRLFFILKIPWVFFILLFGSFMYPINIFIFLYFLFIIILLSIAIKDLSKDSKECIFFFLFLIYLPFIVFFILEPLLPPFGSIAPRHLIFLLPIFYLFLIRGLSRLSNKKFYLLILPLIIGNIIFTGFSIKSMHNELNNWKRIYEELSKLSFKPEIIICDGRSSLAIERYFKFNVPIFKIEELINKDKFYSYSKIFLITDDWRKEKIEEFNLLLSNIRDHYEYNLLYYKFPTFIFYLYKPKQDILNFKNLLPLNISTIEFNDLKLPLVINFLNNEFKIDNILTLNNKNKETSIIFSKPISIDGIYIFSNITSKSVKLNSIVAEVQFFIENNLIYTIPLKNNIDTGYWLSKEKKVPIAYLWRKKILFAGSSAYIGSWRDTLAYIYGKYIEITPIKIDNIKIVLKEDKCEFNLFGIFLDKHIEQE